MLAAWLIVTAAVTPKGERRREALVGAAAALLCEHGFEGVSHRAVAARAGLPLASTTYYFASLEELIAAAVEHLTSSEENLLRRRLDGLSRRRRGPESTAELLVELLVDDGPGNTHLVSRYERYLACARQPALRDIQRRIHRQRTAAVGEVVARSGRCARTETLTALVCAVDGAVVSALVEEQPTPRATARATLIDVIDVLAPYDRGTARP